MVITLEWSELVVQVYRFSFSLKYLIKCVSLGENQLQILHFVIMYTYDTY